MLKPLFITTVFANDNEGIDIYKNFLIGGHPSQFTTIASLVNLLYKSLLVLAGIVFLFLVILGGFSYIAGAGEEKSNQVEKGKKAITWAIIGFLIIFSAYWLIQIVGLFTGVPILNSNL